MSLYRSLIGKGVLVTEGLIGQPRAFLSLLFSRKHGCWLFNFFLSIEMPFGHRFLGKECFNFSWFLCDVCVCWNRTNKAGMLFAWKISSYLLSIVSGGQTLIPVAIFFNIYSAVMPQIYVWIVLCMICEIHFIFIIDRLRPELSIKVMYPKLLNGAVCIYVKELGVCGSSVVFFASPTCLSSLPRE